MSEDVQDQPGLLYGMGLYRKGIFERESMWGKKFRGRMNGRSDHVLRSQEPAAADYGRMEGGQEI